MTSYGALYIPSAPCALMLYSFLNSTLLITENDDQEVSYRKHFHSTTSPFLFGIFIEILRGRVYLWGVFSKVTGLHPDFVLKQRITFNLLMGVL